MGGIVEDPALTPRGLLLEKRTERIRTVREGERAVGIRRPQRNVDKSANHAVPLGAARHHTIGVRISVKTPVFGKPHKRDTAAISKLDG